MIIPIRCMSCGNPIADKWLYYKNELKKVMKFGNGVQKRFYMDGTQIEKTYELEIMEKVGFKRPCCRKHFLTHVDLIEKI
jgi:DNA-directed RNA polymerase I, II, and III subunit RPABC5